MLTLKGHKVEYPLSFAVAMNGNSKLGYSKGGFPLNQNGMPMDKTGRNPFTTK